METSISTCHLVTATGEHRLRVTLAARFFSRLRGLMLAPPLAPEQGLLLWRCTSIHTCFMRQTIDVIYLDRSGMVVRCVPALQPWRFSVGQSVTGRHWPASHALELRAGSIARLQIRPGSRLHHYRFATAPVPHPGLLKGRRPLAPAARQRGSAMIEFTVVAPIITLIGLATIQYGMLFFAKNQYNHAAFMAARAGSVGNADIVQIKKAYAHALIPLYARGTTTAALATAYDKALKEVEGFVGIEMLNPTAESFEDFNDKDLQKSLGGNTQRVIPNGGLAYKKAAIVPAASGQNIHDANLLKLRITQAYKPQVPLVGGIYTRYLTWLDDGTSGFNTKMIKAGRVPVVTQVTLHMQSDAIEGATVSSPGMGNAGTPTDPGMPTPPRGAPPVCGSVLCGGGAPGAGTGGGSDGGAGPGDGGGSAGGTCEMPA